MFTPAFWTYWYFHLPNFILAAVMYTLLARFLLGIILPHDSKNYIWRFFCTTTNPVIAVVRRVTPLAAPSVILWLFAFVWMFWLRFVLFVAFNLAGLAPTGTVQ